MPALATLEDDFDDYPLTEEIPPAPGRPMPDEHFYYGVFKETVDLLAQHTEADPIGHVATLYSYLGCMIGRQYSVFGEPPTCNPILVGDAGTGRKGTGEKDVRRLFADIQDTKMLPNISRSCATKAGLVREVRDKSEKEKDGIPVDIGVEDKRLWVCVSEFGQVLQDMKNPIFKLQDAACDLYDGEDQHISTSKGIVTATDPAVTFYGNITGEMLALRFDPHALAGGILTRMMPVFVERARYYRGLVLPEEYKRERAAKGLLLAERINGMREKVGKGKTREMTFSKEVQRMWRREWHEYLTTPPSHLSGFARMWTSRRAGNFRRIATIIALAHETDEIGMEHAYPALSFVDLSMNHLPYIEKEFGIATVGTPRSAAMSQQARKWYAYMMNAHAQGRESVPRKEVTAKVFSNNLGSDKIDALENEIPGLDWYMDEIPGHPTATKFYRLTAGADAS